LFSLWPVAPFAFFQLANLFASYFEGPLNESSIKRNFVLIYELLDEAMDFGFPQLTEPASLKSLITQKGVRIDPAQLLQKGIGGLRTGDGPPAVGEGLQLRGDGGVA
jgi:hypothetical protein